ncbi:MAG: hypothetical protein KY453_01935 [Gemmatimonadetes bacterium]|nr:hypothetical protein [Gemmatimonadota bacterium]
MRASASNVRIAEGTSPAAAAGRVLAVLTPICGALVLGVALFAAVVTWLFLDGTAPLSPGVLPGPALVVAASLAAAILLAAPTLERRLGESPSSASMDEVATRFQTGATVGFALREGAGLLGLVLSLLGGTLPWALAFAGGSLEAMALAWPKRAELEARLRKAAARG